MWTGSAFTALESMISDVSADAKTIAIASLGVFAIIVGVGLVKKIVNHFAN